MHYNVILYLYIQALTQKYNSKPDVVMLPVVSGPGKERQEDHEFKANLT